MALKINDNTRKGKRMLHGLLKSGEPRENAHETHCTGSGDARVRKATGDRAGKNASAPHESPQPATAPSSGPRPGSLRWATEHKWQLATHYEGSMPLVYAWKASGERTAMFPPGPITTEETWYRPALQAAVEMEQ